MFKRFIQNLQLKSSEIEWGLYDKLPKFKVDYLFAFIDQLKTGGNYNSQVVIDKDICVNNGVIVVNLNKRVNREVIIHTLIHEDLHIAIRNCLYKEPNNDFIEKIIDDWILEMQLICEGWDGTMRIETKSSKTTD